MQGVTPSTTAHIVRTDGKKNTTTTPGAKSFSAVLDQRREERSETPAKRSSGETDPTERISKKIRPERKGSTHVPVQGSMQDSMRPGAMAPGGSWHNSSTTADESANAAGDTRGGDPNGTGDGMQIEGVSAQPAEAPLNSRPTPSTTNTAAPVAGWNTLAGAQRTAWGDKGLGSAGLSDKNNLNEEDLQPTPGDVGLSGAQSSDPALSRAEDGPATIRDQQVTEAPDTASLAGVARELTSQPYVSVNPVHAKALAQSAGARDISSGVQGAAMPASLPLSPLPGVKPSAHDEAVQDAAQYASQYAGREQSIGQAAGQGAAEPVAKTTAANSPLGKPRKEGRAAMGDAGPLANTLFPEGQISSAYSVKASASSFSAGEFGAEPDHGEVAVPASTQKHGQNSEASPAAARDLAGAPAFSSAMGTANILMGSSGKSSGLGDRSNDLVGSTAKGVASQDTRLSGTPHIGDAVPGATLPSVNTARLMSSLTQSEMRVGVRSAEFGSVTVHTAFGRDAVSAQISLENAQLGTALSAHLPSIEQKLAQDHGLRASVTLHTGSDAGNDTSAGYGSRSGAEGEQRQGEHSRRTSLMQGTGSLWSTAESTATVIAPSASLSRAGQGRLDVRI